jgi:hypothetical protein
VVAYTAEQKAEAIELAGDVGLREAARRLGIPPGTIGCWRSRTPGVVADSNAARQVAIAAANTEWVERRVKLGNRMGEVAAEILERIATKYRRDELAAQRLASTLRVLVDKAQLLTGGATEIVGHAGVEGQSAEERALALRDELRARREARAQREAS